MGGDKNERGDYFLFGLPPWVHSFDDCRSNLGQEGGSHNGGGETTGSTAVQTHEKLVTCCTKLACAFSSMRSSNAMSMHTR